MRKRRLLGSHQRLVPEEAVLLSQDDRLERHPHRLERTLEVSLEGRSVDGVDLGLVE